jgi:hypothetical protein
MKVWVRATRGQLSAQAHGSVTMLTRVEFEISVAVVAKALCEHKFTNFLSLYLKTCSQAILDRD